MFRREMYTLPCFLDIRSTNGQSFDEFVDLFTLNTSGATSLSNVAKADGSSTKTLFRFSSTYRTW